MTTEALFYNKMIEYRKQIDKEDQIILNAVERRFKIVEEVSHAKSKNHKSCIDLFFNMKRENSMIRDLINKAQLPQKIIFAIWRNFISFANFYEQKIDVFYDTEEAQIQLCKNYPAFCGLAKKYDADVLLKPNQPIMAILKLNQASSWWYDIFVDHSPVQNNLYIFNLLPEFNPSNLCKDIFAVVGYIDEKSLEDDYKIYIVPTEKIKSEIILSKHKEMSLIITKSSILCGRLVGLTGKKI